MSQLGVFLKTLRTRRNCSTLSLSQSIGFEHEDYVRFEEHPEQIPLCRLVTILRALCIEAEEYMDFSLLVLGEFEQRRSTLQ